MGERVGGKGVETWFVAVYSTVKRRQKFEHLGMAIRVVRVNAL